MTSHKITKEDLPALYRLADDKSIESQRYYILLFGINLVVLCLSSIIAAFNIQDWKIYIATGLFICFVFNLILIGAIKLFTFSKNWYDARAVAESIKTLSWKYMIGGEPYPTSLEQEDVDKKFIFVLQNILKETPDILALNKRTHGSEDNITPKMKQIRNLNLEERKEIYIQSRIEEQRKWYSTKAELNTNMSWCIFGIVAVIIIIICIIFWMFLKTPDIIITATQISTTAISSLIAWLQLKQYEQLSQSYTIAAYDLALIKESYQNVKTEEDFAKFVDDSENAISREHTLWLARKGNSIKK